MFRSRAAKSTRDPNHQSLMESVVNLRSAPVSGAAAGTVLWPPDCYDRARKTVPTAGGDRFHRRAIATIACRFTRRSGDWQSAIEVALNGMVKLREKRNNRGEIANLGELALLEDGSADLDRKAMAVVEKAFAIGLCQRPSWATDGARVQWMEKGDYAKAVRALEQVIDQDKELVVKR